MKRILLSAIPAALLLASCSSGPDKWVATPSETSPAEAPKSYIITDYKNKTEGAEIPAWVSRYLENGANEIETLDTYQDRYVFVSRNEGNNFNALNQWTEGFSPELDFPRLAAARIEARFSSTVLYPDMEYGSFFEALIRAASDASWTGAVQEEDFWIRRRFFSWGDTFFGEQAEQDSRPTDIQSPDFQSEDSPFVRDTLEFLILVTIEKERFASLLDAVFQSIKPVPPPSRDQLASINRVKARFYEGF